MSVTTRPLPTTIPKPPPPPEWSTWVPGRVPAVKLHKNSAHAKSALRTNGMRNARGRYVVVGGKRTYEYPLGQSALYRFIDGEWKVVAIVNEGDWPSEHIVWNTDIRLLVDEITSVITED